MRQKEVVLLSVQGMPNAQIARRLGISPHTLKDHQKDIYQRLHINSHHELVERLAPAAMSVSG
jgi:DNA-binding CsgD family transcriptional regulator